MPRKMPDEFNATVGFRRELIEDLGVEYKSAKYPAARSQGGIQRGMVLGAGVVTSVRWILHVWREDHPRPAPQEEPVRPAA